MTRRKHFDPGEVDVGFWRARAVQEALARRDVGMLFRAYLHAHPSCTQTQLAWMTEHDRSDISNFVRGTRKGTVTDIEVLTRIADGLDLPDDARLLLGLAPTHIGHPAPSQQPATSTTCDSPASDKPSTDDSSTGGIVDGGRVRVAICGSRAPGTRPELIDEAVRSLARLVVTTDLLVDHGPVGIGMEVMTYVADHYRRADTATGLFGHANVVRRAAYLLVAGGGEGTRHELELAQALNKTVLTFPASGGTAHAWHTARTQLGNDHDRWYNQDLHQRLEACTDAETWTRIIAETITNHQEDTR